MGKDSQGRMQQQMHNSSSFNSTFTTTYTYFPIWYRKSYNYAKQKQRDAVNCKLEKTEEAGKKFGTRMIVTPDKFFLNPECVHQWWTNSNGDSNSIMLCNFKTLIALQNGSDVWVSQNGKKLDIFIDLQFDFTKNWLTFDSPFNSNLIDFDF